MRLLASRSVAAAVALVALAAGGSARGDVLDLALHRLVTPPVPGQAATPDLSAQTAYRQFVSELGVVMAPQILTPADTVGYSGFQFTLDAGFTSISNNKCVPGETRDRCPWQYAVSGRDANGVAKDLPSMASTLSIMARKGIWLPLPSFEIGAGATKLMQSDIFALQLYAKFALHEGFHDWPLPSLSVRGSATRVLGASQLDLTMAQVDVNVSQSFGLVGSVPRVAYLGFASLGILARGQVLDTTPDIDAFKLGPGAQDLNANAVFQDQDTILRWRFFGGLRLSYSILVLTFDYMATACGDLGAGQGGACSRREAKMGDAKIPDNATTQHTVSVSAGFLF